MDTELYKIRSLGGCIKAAFDLYRTNIKTIFRRTWAAATVWAVANAALMLAVNHFVGNMLSFARPNPAGIVAMVVTLLLAYAAYTWFYAIIVALLNGSSMKLNLPRVIRFALLMLAIGIVVVAIASAIAIVPMAAAPNLEAMMAASARSTIANGLLILTLFIVLVPLYFSTMKYLMETDQKLLSIFKKPFATGWKHWGYIFMLCLLAGLIIVIIDFVASLPAGITAMATQYDISGQSMGDTSGLPAYFMLLAFIANAVSAFIMVYVAAWGMMVMYYGYGHIEAKEKAKKEMNLTSGLQTDEVDIKTKPSEPDFEEIR